MHDTSEADIAPRTATRKRKKKYPAEAVYATAGIAFFVGIGIMWAAVSSVRTDTEALGQRVTSLETVVVSTGERVQALMSTLSDDSATRSEQEKTFQEQLALLSSGLSTQQSQIQSVVQSTDRSAAIAHWSPFVYMLECSFTMSNGVQETDKGSATLERTISGVRLITNRHVIEREDANFDSCVLMKPDSDVTIDVDDSRFVKSEAVDYAYAPIEETKIEAMLFTQRCSTKPSIGDPVLILGYPGIGAKESITATEGIISGFDADYYTTSAKIEKGNSGGAAVDIERNCFLGLPTLVFSGRVESLARILPVIGL